MIDDACVLSERVILGSGPWGRVGRAERLGLMRQAWAIGIRRVDTAPSYGFGAVERDVFAHWPGVIDTKVGLEPRRIHRLIAPIYPSLRRVVAMRSPRIVAGDRTPASAGAAAAAPRRLLGDNEIRVGVKRLKPAHDERLGFVWIHDPESTRRGLEARAMVLRELELPEERCGLAWTTEPNSLPDGVPLLLPFNGSNFDRSDRPTHWQGVIRYLRHRHASDPALSAPMEHYLAGVLLRLPATHRLVIGSYRSDHLDLLHRSAALCTEALGDRARAKQLDAAVQRIEDVSA